VILITCNLDRLHTNCVFFASLGKEERKIEMPDDLSDFLKSPHRALGGLNCCFKTENGEKLLLDELKV